MDVHRSALGRKLASCVMSVVLAVGLVPAPALAEAANELQGLVVVEEPTSGDAISLGEEPSDAVQEEVESIDTAHKPFSTTEWTNVTINGVALQIAVTDDNSDFVDNGDGTYTIKTAAGWDAFASSVNGGTSYSGKTVKLDADIEVTSMAGTSNHDFRGTFDGQGHTLTVLYGTADAPIDEDKAAPFRNVESGCTIEGLRVAGDIFTSKKYAGGLVGAQYGTVTIRNCRVSTTIHSRTSGDGSHGGIVGHNGNSIYAKLTVEGCVFDGKIIDEGG